MNALLNCGHNISKFPPPKLVPFIILSFVVFYWILDYLRHL